MAISIQNITGAIGAFVRSIGNTAQPSAGEGILAGHLEDLNGRPLAMLDNQQVNNLQYGLPITVRNDNNTLMLRGDRSGGVAVATTQPLFSWFIEGTALNTRLFSITSATQTALQTQQGLTLNSGTINIASTAYQVNTARSIPLHMKAPVLMRSRARVTQIGVANTTAEFGFATVNTSLGSSANLNGVYWRIDGTGIVPIIAFNGAVVVTGTPVATLNSNDYYHWGILRDDDSYLFTIQNSATGVVIYRQNLQVPAGQQKAFLASHAWPYARTFNGAVAPTVGTQLVITEWTIGLLDTNLNLTQSQIATNMGLGSELNPVTYATNSNISNSAVAVTTAPNNSAATVTALDGAMRFTAPAGSVTDLALFTYTVPLPYQYRTKRVVVAAKNLGATVATTPTQIDYYLSYNILGVNLVSASVRKYIGTQTFPVGAIAGSSAQEGRLQLDFTEADAITEAGRALSLIARISTGTATVAQVIETNYTNIGHFE